MYQQVKATYPDGTSKIAPIVIRLTDGANIPFDPANTDHQKFKSDVLAGAELQDADGNVMTQEEADTFIATLP